MLESWFTVSLESAELTLSHVLLTVGVSVLAGLLISYTYMRTNPGYSQGFILTMVLLPVVVAIIILLIGSNIARAFSLAGAFSIIRFRSAAGDPKDITFVLLAMAAGLASGVGAFAYGMLFALLLCLLMFILHVVRYGRSKSEQRLLKVTIPEDLNYEEAFADVFAAHHVRYELQKIRTTELGSLYELVYQVTLDGKTDRKAFLDGIRCRNGNLDLSLTMTPVRAEY
ncbi:DUF4956 domain-containing protein [Paenibacillus sp. IB182496]|uniref:DUF4956 domain-containing protein n=1 Tax=Paenibacillus sabuli TaxID=2772509 RepID=A0A927BS75_9BACL|nr:DUF4956 domain-containing protein [Paenibacillus sabuli]MBD2845332.1 DUF4956 domain-containing protein [Paenibacillus sabuli]